MADKLFTDYWTELAGAALEHADAVGIEDVADLYTATDVEGALAEVRTVADAAAAAFTDADAAKLASLLAPLVADSFDRADSASSMGTADTGQAWTLLSGGSWSVPATPYGISGNLAYLTADVVGSNLPLAVVDSGLADCTIQATIDALTGTAGICFRVVDIDNHLFVDTSGIYKRVAGTTTRLGSTFSPSVTTGDVLRLVLSGESITLYVNNVLRHSTSSTSHQTATKHGIRANNDATRINDFSVHPPSLTASEILTAIKTVDGTGSGLDADTLDGNEATAFATSGHDHSGVYQPLATVLTNTTASFTTADESKLDGIEAGADVTDATNVAAAGAVMESDTSTALMSFVIDEDNMATDSATKVPTQQSTKAYADLKVAKATFPGSVTVALSDMTTQITTGTTKAYWVNPFDTALTISKVKATLATAGSGATVVDVNEGSGTGTSILSTKITIDANETDSDDATTPPVISDSSIAADGRLTFDIDTAGTSAAGLQVTLLFTRAV